MRSSELKVLLVNPRKDFKSRESVVGLVSGEKADVDLMHYFDVGSLAFIVDGDGLPLELPCAFLAETALMSRSVTGDTVRTYAEALIPWLHFLRRRKTELVQVTEEHLGLYKNHLVNGRHGQRRLQYASSTANHRVVVAAQFHTLGGAARRDAIGLGHVPARQVRRARIGRAIMGNRRQSSKQQPDRTARGQETAEGVEHRGDLAAVHRRSSALPLVV